jgi:hypothetical protein
MDSRETDRIRDLLSRLIEVLRFLVDRSPLQSMTEKLVLHLANRLSEARDVADNPYVLQLIWPEIKEEVHRLLDFLSRSGIEPAGLRSLIDYLSGNSVMYMVSPPVRAGELESAIAAVVSEADDIVRRSDLLGGTSSGPAAAPLSYGEKDDETPVCCPAPAESRKEESKPSTRLVNSGFCDRAQPEKVMDPAQPLKLNVDYWFWVEIGALQRGSIEDSPSPLPDSLPATAQLTVTLFSFPGELILSGNADVGIVRLTGGVASEVVDQPGIFEYLFLNNPIRKTRLFFPVKTPPAPGRYRMRCNIYYEHVLVQSRIVAAHVAQAPEGERALRSTLDYKLSHTLDPTRLSRMGRQTLSVFINDNPDGTHGFYFEGEQQFKTQASLDGQLLEDSLNQVRKALRRVAWGSSEPWQPSFKYRYGAPGEPGKFAKDLIALAIRGYMLYSGLIDNISGGAKTSEKLAAMMLKPGRVQISSEESARLVVPAALFYDRPLDTQAPQHHVCEAFLKDLGSTNGLQDSECFRGECPHLNELDVVCPSGFWGYRHEVGLPVSIERITIGDAETDIQFSDPASMVMIVSLDKMFTEREPHETQLKLLRTSLDLTLCDSRSKAIKALQEQPAEIFYFYCHGGITQDNTPFLGVGENESLTPDNIRAYKIRWCDPRPLVFLNGCMTAALEPEKAIDFVSAFVNQAAASGVIGTEITVFEPLATKFAEAFLRCFMGECKSIGESIKLARLSLLQQMNPLGLVYIPFALPGLHLADLAAAKSAASNGHP